MKNFNTQCLIFQSVNEENDLEFVYEDADEFNTEIAGETMVGFVYGEPEISKRSDESMHLCRLLKPFLPCNAMSTKILCWLICSLDVHVRPNKKICVSANFREGWHT